MSLHRPGAASTLGAVTDRVDGKPEAAALPDPRALGEAVQTLLDSATSALLVVDAAGHVIAANAAVRTHFAVSPDEVRGSAIEPLLDAIAALAESPEHAREVLDTVRKQPVDPARGRAAGEEHRDTFILERPTRRVIGAYCGAIGEPGAALTGTIWAFEDVTDSYDADQQLRTLVSAAPVPLIITRLGDGRILFCNEPLARIVDTTAAELTGRASPDFYHDRDDRDLVLGDLRKTGMVNREIRLRTVTGKERWALFALSRTELSGEAVIVGAIIDITSRKQAETRLQNALDALELAYRELNESRAQLVQSEKMASLGMLVAGVAHEVNTPIAAVASMHDTLTRSIDKLREALSAADPELLDRSDVARSFTVIDNCNRVIRDGTLRVGELVKRLKSFARLDEAELKTVDVHSGIEDTLALIQHELKGIDVVREYGELPALSCFPSRLNQVFLNLLMNAKQALGTSGTVTISTAADDERITVRVRDDGPGIAPEHLPKIFDPGFTTKGVRVGAGLGLSICYRIMEEHRGSIRAESTPGEGATFEVVVPLNLREQLGAGT